MLDGAIIVNVTDEALPETGTLPVPVQPLQTHWIPELPGTGDVTDSVMLDPESNQPLNGVGESYGEVTVK
jgi:hypothetical protein